MISISVLFLLAIMNFVHRIVANSGTSTATTMMTRAATTTTRTASDISSCQPLTSSVLGKSLSTYCPKLQNYNANASTALLSLLTSDTSSFGSLAMVCTNPGSQSLFIEQFCENNFALCQASTGINLKSCKSRCLQLWDPKQGCNMNALLSFSPSLAPIYNCSNYVDSPCVSLDTMTTCTNNVTGCWIPLPTGSATGPCNIVNYANAAISTFSQLANGIANQNIGNNQFVTNITSIFSASEDATNCNSLFQTINATVPYSCK